MILVTGATGFVGSHVINKLEETGQKYKCFVRNTSDTTYLKSKNIELVYGSFDEPDSYNRALEGIDTLINIASLGFGHAETIVGGAVRNGVKRAIFVSTTALFTTLEAKTKSVRIAAEKAITDSGLDYTILRPTMIYGTHKDRNMCRLIKIINGYPLIPIAGDGNSLQQPIHVEDLAEAIVKVVHVSYTINKAYNLSGKYPVSYNQVIDTIVTDLNKNIFKLKVNTEIAIKLVKLYNRFSSNPKIKVEQLLRLNENKSFDHQEASRDFGFSPRSFEEGIRQEISLMRSLQLV
ncbi:SDR family oxidoreductase [Paenibacillus alginolyticus]|uniref:NAD(P)H-binding protein n=1 Tax=Paenibacillus alginolyticus TaxID=59839 RepID=A0ABT4G8Q9_9BACL|nr:NAD(P)H-binding protein [Paenibacillus alginolyticus]MCY9692570.1 NAD(P)H-binding protein [Paenibacillus alginolyticus]MEC0143776.1 NAD(P)H-binding protein [Paenibacillus alginolyticus]